MIDMSQNPPLDWYSFTIPKKSGGQRKLTVPNDDLKAVQRQILDQLYTVPELEPTQCAHGFVPFKSTSTNAAVHWKQARVIICIDLKDFFDNMPLVPVEKQLRLAGLSTGEIRYIMRMCTYKAPEAEQPGFVQGAPTSPYLTNIGMFDTDRMLAAFAKRHGYTYTRYADDMTFAEADFEENPRFRKYINYRRIIEAAALIVRSGIGLELNRDKTHVCRIEGSTPRRVTGIVIRKDGMGYNIPRRMRRKLRAVLHIMHSDLAAGAAPELMQSAWRTALGRVSYSDHTRSYSEEGYEGKDPIIPRQKMAKLRQVLGPRESQNKESREERNKRYRDAWNEAHSRREQVG